MLTKPKLDFLAILGTLTRHRVEFIVVGGVAGVLHGTPISTFDLDLVHNRTPENVDRLLEALGTLNAHYRTRPAEKRKPDRSHLASRGHQLLMTRSGPLDLRGVIGVGRGYDELIGEAVEVELGGGLKVRVLDLPALIRAKEETAQEKDRAVLPILRRTLEERRKKSSS